jgi:CBS domain-containing protein
MSEGSPESQGEIPPGISQAREDIPISTVDSPSAVLELIYQLKIKDVMVSAVITAGRTDSMRYIQTLMRENYITGVPITEEGVLAGIVSIDDIVTALDKGYIDCPAEERMTRDVIVLEDDMPLSFAISYLNKYRYGRFPVVNKKKELVGIIIQRCNWFAASGNEPGGFASGKDTSESHGSHAALLGDGILHGKVRF